MQEKTYTTFQAADICNVQPTTIIKWADQKKIKAYVTPGGHRRIRQSDLLSFLKQYQFPIPRELDQSKKYVLIVEDDTSVGQLLEKALERSSDDLHVEWTTDGIEALLMLGKRTPDLVILDVVMPVVDGTKVLATLRSDSKTRKIKTVGITGKRLQSDKIKYIQSNTDAFYFKPFDVNELTRKCLNLLRIPSGNQTATTVGKES